jgi:hypothetical protein
MIMSEDFSFSDLLKQAENAGGAFEPLPNGEYEVVVDTATAQKTNTGKSKIAVRYKVQGGPYNNRTVFNDHVLTPGNPNAMIIFFRQMSAVGLKSDYFASNPSMERVAADMIGKKARLRLGTREWQNVKRNSVLAILPSTGSPGAVPGLPAAPSFSVPPPLSSMPIPPAPVPVAPAPVPPAPVPEPPAAVEEEIAEQIEEIIEEQAAAPLPSPPPPAVPPVITQAPSLPF